MIKLKNVTLKYISEYTMLNNINLNIDSNTLIIGSKDGGTHSLMRLLSKIDKAYTGEVLIDSTNIRNIKDRDLSIGYVPSEPYLFKHRRVYYNLYYPFKIRGIKNNETKELINETIDKYLSSFPNKLKVMTPSEKKIITLLRVMIRQPKYVLIEDLFVNLDTDLIPIACDILDEISKHSIIIACDSDSQYYNNFTEYTLSYGSLKKYR